MTIILTRANPLGSILQTFVFETRQLPWCRRIHKSFNPSIQRRLKDTSYCEFFDSVQQHSRQAEGKIAFNSTLWSAVETVLRLTVVVVFRDIRGTFNSWGMVTTYLNDWWRFDYRRNLFSHWKHCTRKPPIEWGCMNSYRSRSNSSQVYAKDERICLTYSIT